jgi:hypothetical protein
MIQSKARQFRAFDFLRKKADRLLPSLIGKCNPGQAAKEKRKAMNFKPIQCTRTGTMTVRAALRDVFPLLCPKREEEWIPGWQCETIWSRSGHNEEGAVFRTSIPYGTELYWTTLQYDRDRRLVDFLITAPHLFLFRFRIELAVDGDEVAMTFTQTFTSVSKEGNGFLERYQAEDFQGRLRSLEEFMNQYLEGKADS